MQNCNLKFKIKVITFVLLTLTFNFALLTFNLSTASAFTMKNLNWVLQLGNFNVSSGKPTGSNYNLSYTMGQTAPGLYTGTNYKVKAGFQYFYSIIPFSFSISQISIDFGTISPTNPVTRTNNLTISNGSAYGYSVTAFENHELLVPASGALIPDTTCDNGLCTQTTADIWTNSLTYGFGYRCDNVSGTPCSVDFLPPGFDNYYKQFADNSKSEDPESVMSGTNVGTSLQAQITYKVNISAMQAAGLYSNVIVYVATPTF